MSDYNLQEAFREAGKEYAERLDKEKQEQLNPEQARREAEEAFAEIFEAQLESRRTYL